MGVVSSKFDVFLKGKFSENDKKLREITLNDVKSLEKRKQKLESKVQKMEKVLKNFKYTKDDEIVSFVY